MRTLPVDRFSVQLAFDFMIVGGLADIDISDRTGYWVPFLLMAVISGVVTFYFLLYMCKMMYPDYRI